MTEYTIDQLLGADPCRVMLLKNGSVADEELRAWEAIIAGRLDMPKERVQCVDVGFNPDGRRHVAVNFLMRDQLDDEPSRLCVAVVEVGR